MSHIYLLGTVSSIMGCWIVNTVLKILLNLFRLNLFNIGYFMFSVSDCLVFEVFKVQCFVFG